MSFGNFDAVAHDVNDFGDVPNQIPSTNDDMGFYRAIACSLGVSTNLGFKAQQLRNRVEDVLQRGDLMVIFDEAHYLWPQCNHREALPARINWIMTALVNYGVSVALVTTPQFTRAQQLVEKRTHWASEQFIGRIAHYQKLPDGLNEHDLKAVARSLLPEGDRKSIETLVAYAPDIWPMNNGQILCNFSTVSG